MKISELFEGEDEDKNETLSSVVKDAEFSVDIGSAKKNGKRYRTVEYSKEVFIDPYDLVLRYTANPETESWSYAIHNASNGRVVDMGSGEDYSSLMKSIKKKKKILPSWIEKYLSDN
jgi:hypothetical protein